MAPLANLGSQIQTAESMLGQMSAMPPEIQQKGATHLLREIKLETQAHLIQIEDEEGFKDLELGFGEFETAVDGIKALASAYLQEGQSRTVSSLHAGHAREASWLGARRQFSDHERVGFNV
jgi:hypothetical protein